ncbi:uncharacterized protein LOC116261968 [Nymphaea colorata]|uniref:Uncharacterized protein n=1 Tax=Nymphaea colorata TaxID=210225 RepID=A0A5K0WUJ4_9MAGN|nr:uncharacterized protein LOC116261968 [Nymphaea colorata]
MGTTTMMMPMGKTTPCATTLEGHIIGLSLPWLPTVSTSSIQEAEGEAMGHHQSSMPADGEEEGETIQMEPEADVLRSQIGPIFISSLPNWKFYQNPFYQCHHHDHHSREQELETPQEQRTAAMGVQPSENTRCCYQRRIKVLEDQQARTLSLVSFLRSELDLSRDRIAELRSVVKAVQSELDIECSARRRLQGMNRSLGKELEKERAAREVVEGVCEELAKEMGKDRKEVEEMRRECERVREEVEEERRLLRLAEAWREERRMLRMAEVWREERAQTKQAEARRLLEHSISNLSPAERRDKKDESPETVVVIADSAPNTANGGGGGDGDDGRAVVGWNKQHQTENPHIRRGIKGFVEFRRVVRHGVPKGRKVVGSTNAECQKALLRQYILKQRVPVGLCNSGPGSLVMG